MTGAAWRANVTHVHYNNNKIVSRNEHFDENNATVLIHFFTDAKIVHLAAYKIHLWMNRGICPLFSKSFLHYFVKMRTINDFSVTFEKMPTCILSQSAHNFNDPPLEQLRDGFERKRLDTLKLIIEDSEPKDKTVKDVIDWIFEGDELNEKYHILNSNCQQFVMNIWQRFSTKPFPNPAKIDENLSLLEIDAIYERVITKQRESPLRNPPFLPISSPPINSKIDSTSQRRRKLRVNESESTKILSYQFDHVSLFVASLLCFISSAMLNVIIFCAIPQSHLEDNISMHRAIASAISLAVLSLLLALLSQHSTGRNLRRKFTSQCAGINSSLEKFPLCTRVSPVILSFAIIIISICLPFMAMKCRRGMQLVYLWRCSVNCII